MIISCYNLNSNPYGVLSSLVVLIKKAFLCAERSVRTCDSFHYNIRFNSIKAIQIDSMPKLILVHSQLDQSTVANFKSRRPQNWTVIFIEFDAQGFQSQDVIALQLCFVATITKCIFESIENHRFKIKLKYRFIRKPNESNKNLISNAKKCRA